MRRFLCAMALCLMVCLLIPQAGAGCAGGRCSISNARCESSNMHRVRTRAVHRQRVQASSCNSGACGVQSGSTTTTERHRSSIRVTGDHVGSLQAWAELEAKLMAERGTNGHVMGVPGPGYFVGVGANGTTCRGRGTLVAEAHYRGKTVRVWR